MAVGNGGPTASPIPVRVHDFLDRELGKAIPYGVYDLANNEGWVSVGIDHDTAEFAGQRDPAVVDSDGPAALSARPRAPDHRRRRR